MLKLDTTGEGEQHYGSNSNTITLTYFCELYNI